MDDLKSKYLVEKLENLLKSFLSKKSANFVSDDCFKMGKVINNNDSEKIGRCQIMVYQLMEGIPESDLPWFPPEQTYVGSLGGSFIVPPVGSLVNIIFKNGDYYNGFYTTKVIDKNNLPEERTEDYPFSQILFKSDSGDLILVNTKTNEMLLKSASGGELLFDPQGNASLDTLNGMIGDINLHARNLMDLDARFIQAPAGITTPTGTGPFCSLAIDPLTGLPQTGTFFTRQG